MTPQVTQYIRSLNTKQRPSTIRSWLAVLEVLHDRTTVSVLEVNRHTPRRVAGRTVIRKMAQLDVVQASGYKRDRTRAGTTVDAPLYRLCSSAERLHIDLANELNKLGSDTNE